MTFVYSITFSTRPLPSTLKSHMIASMFGIKFLFVASLDFDCCIKENKKIKENIAFAAGEETGRKLEEHDNSIIDHQNAFKPNRLH